jgi:hypothetical protein
MNSLPDKISIGEKYGPAMAITSREEADAYARTRSSARSPSAAGRRRKRRSRPGWRWRGGTGESFSSYAGAAGLPAERREVTRGTKRICERPAPRAS